MNISEYLDISRVYSKMNKNVKWQKNDRLLSSSQGD